MSERGHLVAGTFLSSLDRFAVAPMLVTISLALGTSLAKRQRNGSAS